MVISCDPERFPWFDSLLSREALSISYFISLIDVNNCLFYLLDFKIENHSHDICTLPLLPTLQLLLPASCTWCPLVKVQSVLDSISHLVFACGDPLFVFFLFLCTSESCCPIGNINIFQLSCYQMNICIRSKISNYLAIESRKIKNQLSQ